MSGWGERMCGFWCPEINIGHISERPLSKGKRVVC